MMMEMVWLKQGRTGIWIKMGRETHNNWVRELLKLLSIMTIFGCLVGGVNVQLSPLSLHRCLTLTWLFYWEDAVRKIKIIGWGLRVTSKLKCIWGKARHKAKRMDMKRDCQSCRTYLQTTNITKFSPSTCDIRRGIKLKTGYFLHHQDHGLISTHFGGISLEVIFRWKMSLARYVRRVGEKIVVDKTSDRIRPLERS